MTTEHKKSPSPIKAMSSLLKSLRADEAALIASKEAFESEHNAAIAKYELLPENMKKVEEAFKIQHALLIKQLQQPSPAPVNGRTFEEDCERKSEEVRLRAIPALALQEACKTFLEAKKFQADLEATIAPLHSMKRKLVEIQAAIRDTDSKLEAKLAELAMKAFAHDRETQYRKSILAWKDKVKSDKTRRQTLLKEHEAKVVFPKLQKEFFSAWKKQAIKHKEDILSAKEFESKNIHRREQKEILTFWKTQTIARIQERFQTAVDSDNIDELNKIADKYFDKGPQALIDEIKLINQPSRAGHTPIITAIYNGSLPVAEFLLLYGADVNQQICFGEVSNKLYLTPIRAAIMANKAEMVELLVKNKAKINEMSAEDKMTPVVFAAEYSSNHDMLKKLFSFGAIVDVNTCEASLGKLHARLSKSRIKPDQFAQFTTLLIFKCISDLNTENATIDDCNKCAGWLKQFEKSFKPAAAAVLMTSLQKLSGEVRARPTARR